MKSVSEIPIRNIKINKNSQKEKLAFIDNVAIFMKIEG
jgi:hypothetical protein